MNYWERVYKTTPLENISWNRTQADYLKHAIDEGKIKGKSALDIGCGTGLKSIYLAKHGFDVTGIDISETAIRYCLENARNSQPKGQIRFYQGNILDDLSFLQDRKFDFILDWALLHCIDRSHHQRYLEKILSYSQKGSFYLLRVFSSADKNIDHFIHEFGKEKNKICIFQKKEVISLFCPHFEIIEAKTSRPRRHDNLIFLEFLMKRI